MIIYQSNTDNPFINIATEEFFLRNFTEDIFFLYLNKPSIIVGKHQNTMAEINVPYVMENNLPVVRRLSGGGTVFHDSGNLNYCFIKNGEEGHLVNFKKYSKPILDTLQNLGVTAYLRGKSDLVINDLKFSGNAEHVFKKRILHHGTLLFSSNLSNLNEAIKADWNNFNDKAVRSNRSKVTNISNYLNSELSISDFKQQIINTVLNEQKHLSTYKLTAEDHAQITKLVDEKYSTWQWNFAYSPNYEFTKEVSFNNQKLTSLLRIEKGIINKIDISLSKAVFNEKTIIEEALINTPHDYQKIKFLLNKVYNHTFQVNLSTLLAALF